MMHSLFSLLARRAPMTPFISEVIEATQTRSLVTPTTPLCMCHVLTDVCSRRVLRLSARLVNSSSERIRTLLDAAVHRVRAAATARDGGRSSRAMESAAPTLTLMHRGAYGAQCLSL